MHQETDKTKPKDTFKDSMQKIDKSIKNIVYWTNYLKQVSRK